MMTLGSRIVYTHEAAVARKRSGGWFLPVKGNGQTPHTEPVGEDGLRIVTFLSLTSRDADLHLPNGDCNKTVATWEQNGSGIVTGLVRKMIGKSVGWGSSDDPGYFMERGHMDLYVVRFELRGQGFVYVPTWAAVAEVV